MVELTRKQTENIEFDANSEGIKDNRLKQTTVRVSFDDWDYVKENGLQFAELIREKIRDLKNNTTGHVTQNVKDAYKKIEDMQKRIDKFSDFLYEKKLADEYINFRSHL